MKCLFTRFLILVLALATIAPGVSAASLAPTLPSTTEPAPTVVKDAVTEFNSLSSKEKKHRVKEVKKVLKDFKAQKRAGKEPIASELLQVIFAILIPPVGILLHEGHINSKFWIGLLLTLLFYVPGMIYALIVVLGD